MGLDMYLSKRSYVKNWEFMRPEEHHQITVKKNGKKHPFIKPERITNIIEEVAYWRKANQIHDWFVKHVQNGIDECQESYVTLEQLQELYDTCVLVRDNSTLKDGKVRNGSTFTVDPVEGVTEIQHIEKGKVVADVSVAKELLPTSEGFFFGGTDYDEYYMQDILNTIEMLKVELDINYKGFGTPSYYYRASW